ncbi:MAG: NAD kinase [Robiginitomaculum sp.]
MSTKPKAPKIAFLSVDKPSAQKAMAELIKKYGNVEPEDADILIPLGGDGFMLEVLRHYMPILKNGIPVYGMNQGTIGFLLNNFESEGLTKRLRKAQAAHIQPLRMQAHNKDGITESLAINEISLLRQTRQAAHIRVIIDGKVRLERLMADGILISTPAGSTAYNLSAHGPVIPLGSDVLPLTPISAFRPRRWRGALLKNTAKIKFEILNPKKRPVSAVADSKEVRNITEVSIEQVNDINFTLLFDEGHELDEKILREQFAT